MGDALAVRLKLVLYAGAAAVFAAGSALATEMCVKCTNPDASYACVVNTTTAGTIDTVVKLYCITALAKAGPHASCAIDRNTKPPCQGERKELPMPATIEQALDNPQQLQTPMPTTGTVTTIPPGTSLNATHPGSQAAVGEPAQPAGEAEPEVVPRTVQEMMEKSAKSADSNLAETQKSANTVAKSTSTALEKAGSAVGNAAKSSWKCLSSLFSNC
jgi:hypothetical protein